MSNDLLNPRWEKRPRTNYLAVASNNKMALRSSHRDMYSYASICINNEHDTGYQFTYWVSFHSTKELADRQTKWATNHYGKTGMMFESVELQKLDLKEYKKLSNARLKEVKAKREAWYQEQQTKLEQLTETGVSNV